MAAPRVNQYVELHLHSNYSLLDGASHPEELIERAAQLGYRELAITDHDNLYGAMVWAHTCHRHGIRPITGMELTLAADPTNGRRHHLTLLAENRAGYANLCRLASLAHGHSLSSQAARDRRRRDPCVRHDDLRDHCAGVICLTGCRESEMAHLIDAGRRADAETVLRRWVDWFGRDSVYVELQDNLVRGDRPRNRRLVQLARQVGVGHVATGNVHYHEHSRHRLQDALVAIRHRTTLDQSEPLRRPNSAFDLRSPEQQARRFAQWPEAIVTTADIAERCRFDLTADLGYQLPQPTMVDGSTPDEELARLCQDALARKYTDAERAAAQLRLDEELRLITRHKLAGFFLIYHEVLRLAEQVASEIRHGAPRANAGLPPGRGRGSSVGSIVCYLIGLSHVDPVRNRLFLGRFLNEEMAGLPDIDLDFPRDIRAELFLRVYARWGRDRAALVAMFPTYRIRSAIRDLGRALGLPPREVDRLAKLAEGYGSARDVRTEMLRAPQFTSLVDVPGWSELIELAHDLAGFPRHLSQHVGGVVIASEPLIDSVPIEPASWPGRYICHWDKDSIDDAGMVKIDILGLGMLSLVEECIDHIAVHRGTTVELSRIDFNDTTVYDRICRGDTIGVFQVESRAQAGMLPRSQPRSLDDLAAQVAIVRPGPIVGGAVHPYLERREAMRRDPELVVEMPHECLRPVLEETLGVVLYQEQVVQCAMAMGGFSPGMAEGFRRAMGRRTWQRELPAYREQFLSGAHAQGILETTADAVFGNLIGFAEFGFPKSHATAFAVLAYQSAWLKEHHPPEFYAALFNQWPMGFYAPNVVTNDARRHGVEIFRPCINASQATCTVEGEAVRMGLRYVDGIGARIAALLVEDRHQHGPYRSLFTTVQRTAIQRESCATLIRVGAFDELGVNRRELLWQLRLFSGGMSSTPSIDTARQLRLELPTQQDEVGLQDFTAYERMATDYAVLGLSPDSHPMCFLRAELGDVTASAHELLSRRLGSEVAVAGLVVCRQQPSTAKGTVFLAVEDETGLMNVTIPPALYERERMVIRTSPLVHVRTRLEGHAGDVPLLRAISIRPLATSRTTAPIPVKSWS